MPKKKVLIALPPAMLEQVDYIATEEHRTRSDLIREALRRYLDHFKRTQGLPATTTPTSTVYQPSAVIGFPAPLPPNPTRAEVDTIEEPVVEEEPKPPVERTAVIGFQQNHDNQASESGWKWTNPTPLRG